MSNSIYQQIVLDVSLEDARNGRTPKTNEERSAQAQRINQKWTEYLRALKASRDPKPWNRKLLSLATARDKEPINMSGSGFILRPEPGATIGSVRIDDPANDGLDLPLNRFMAPFSSIVLTHEAQPERSLEIIAINPGWDVDSLYDIGSYKASTTFTITSDSKTHFTGALATGAIELENLKSLPARWIKIRGITLRSVQSLKYRVGFWTSSSGQTGVVDTDSFAKAQVIDLPNIGWQVAGAGIYYADIQGLDWVYKANDYLLHVGLQNLSAAAKSAGTSGAVVLAIDYSVIE